MDIFIVIVLCLVGILLILLEIFLIPGITFALVGGLVFGAGGVFYAYSKLGTIGGTVTLVSMLILFGFTFIWLIKSKALDKTIALKTDINSTVATNDSLSVKEGDEGICLSRLNPIGKVKVNGITMEAKSFGEFIDENTPVVIVKVNPVQLVVKSIN
ncbi:MAG: NfeD family protein [Dysgonamonadaceae bacterium]|jgi:membrane-bound ClpP family serine protease|nr:NfeD family protein [Dysgonamonadaceae bacterium]